MAHAPPRDHRVPDRRGGAQMVGFSGIREAEGPAPRQQQGTPAAARRLRGLAVGAPKLAIDHVTVPVRDAAATRRFYSEVLGLSLVDAISGDDWEGFPWLMMIYADASGRQIALCAYRGRRHTRERVPTDSRHYALAAASAREMGAWKKRLREARVAFREEDHGAQRSIYFEDPSGNILEITSSPSRRHVARGRKGAADRAVDRWVNAGRAPSRASPRPRPSPPPRSRGGSDAGHDGRPGRTRSRR